ncbi:MAG: triose-phosphate isomerase [Patescibacteria group bacterium]|nr:triose-phosphate isomerase [Patescibacteria group bacterium]
MQPIIAGNWKMNPVNIAEAKLLVTNLKKMLVPIVGYEVMVVPPYPYLSDLNTLLRLTSIKIGAQNIHELSSGAYTGEISLPMISDYISFVLLGHSERRAIGETDKQINKKIHKALENDLKVILCVGEDFEEFKQRNHEIILDQLEKALANVSVKHIEKNLLIAYEPVWAIGTGIPADPDYVERNVFLIKQFIASLYNKEIVKNLPILYGGSVNANNCQDFIVKNGIDGFLVGGASLDPKEFTKICQQTKELYSTKK